MERDEVIGIRLGWFPRLVVGAIVAAVIVEMLTRPRGRRG